MADIFDEIEEDLRRDRAKNLWDRFGKYVIGACVAIVVGAGVWQVYDAQVKSAEAAAGDRFLDALELADTDRDAGIAALNEIIADGRAGYPQLAAFRLASERAAAGDVPAAISGFDALAEDAGLPEEMRNLARLRAAYLLLDSGNREDVERRISALAVSGSAYRHSARELMAFAAMKDGDLVGARAQFETILTDLEAPEGIRNRAQIGLAVIAAQLPGATG
ncbi:MAG: tetratricopeptide repeat protein [Hyphomicrobiaceae bacterium]|nr:tetratricopeptide repeat protein [Hyphomicrobiaceae bacterium]